MNQLWGCRYQLLSSIKLVGLWSSLTHIWRPIIIDWWISRIYSCSTQLDLLSSFIQLMELLNSVEEIRKSITKLHNSFRIMELHKSVVEIHHWFMDLHTSIIGIQSWLTELHSSLYEGSQFHSWRFIITKTGCQLHWQRSPCCLEEPCFSSST